MIGYVPIGVFALVCTLSVVLNVGLALGAVNVYVAAGGRLVAVKLTDFVLPLINETVRLNDANCP